MKTEEKVKRLERQILEIQLRNNRVELNKAWETSFERKFSIAVLTYLSMIAVMYVLRVDEPYLSAIILSFGFVLSTFSLDIIKEYWLKNKK